MSEPDYDFLNEEAPEEIAAVETPEVVEPVAETVEETPPVAQAPEATTAPETVEEGGLKAALKAERTKRQQYERELVEYRQAQQQKPQFFENPEHFVEQTVSSRVFAMSEAQAREMYPDYDEAVQEFVEYARDKPYVIADLNGQAHPALYAYKQAKALRERQEMADLPAFKAKLEAEIRTKLEAEFEAKAKAKEAAVASLPPDLSAVRASKDTDVVPDDSLDSILKSKR